MSNAESQPRINSLEYWDARFETDWESRGGPEQTRFFTQVLLDSLPDWIRRELGGASRTLLDVGCAEGQASELLASSFPRLKYHGVDFSSSCIEKARARYPQRAFSVITEYWEDLKEVDFVLCSNTLEHLHDWRNRIDVLCGHAKRAVFVLVPYRERNLESEHVARFDENAFPTDASGHRLVYAQVIHTAAMSGSRWNGEQLLVVYSRGERRRVRRAAGGAENLREGVDLRGLGPSLIPDALRRSAIVGIREQGEEILNEVHTQKDDLSRVNSEWSQKFQTMVGEFEEKLRQANVHFTQTIEGLNEQIRAGKQEKDDAIRHLIAELDAAKSSAELVERKLAFVEDLHTKEISTLKNLAEREAKVLVEAAEEARSRENMKITADFNARHSQLIAEIDRLRADHAAQRCILVAECARAVEEKQAAERSHTERVEAHAREVERLHAAHQSEISSLRSELRGLEEERQRLRLGHAALEADAGVLRGAISAFEEKVRNAELEYAAQLSAESARFAGKLVECEADWQRRSSEAETRINVLRQQLTLSAQNARELRVHYENHLDGINRYLDGLAQQAVTLVDRLVSSLAGPHHESCPAQHGSAGAPVVAAASEAQFLRNLLGSLRLECNVAGMAPSAPTAVAESPRASAPLDIDESVVVAMQLEAFDAGGLERVVFDLCCGLKARGCAVVVLCRRDGALAVAMRKHGVDVHMFKDLDEYRSLLTSQRVTHLFLHHSYRGADIALGLGVQVFDVVHNTYIWKAGSPEEVAKVGHAAAKVICVSSAVRDFHTSVFGIPTNHAIVVNNPINTDGFIIPDQEQLRQIRHKSPQTTFLNVANVYPAKAQLPMLAAFAEAARRVPDIRLLIVGGEADSALAGTMRKFIEDHALRGKAAMLGSLNRRQLSRLYAEAHAFVLPSLYEGYSVSAVEAASYGLPLILTDVGGARDLVDDNDCGIILPAIVGDLTSCDAAMIQDLANRTSNTTTQHLIAAFEEVARNRSEWVERGFNGMSKPQSLDDVVHRYLVLVAGHPIAIR